MKTLFKFIFNTFRYAGKLFTVIRNTFFNVLFFSLLAVIIFSFIPFKAKEKLALPSESILRLDISGNIVEQKKIISSFEKLLEDPFWGDSREVETTLQDILDIINSAANDDNISVLLLNLKNMGSAGLNQLESIGETIQKFQQSGKTVVAAENYYTQGQYFLASYADTIILNPMGGVDIHGMGVYRLYFKEALERLKINYNIFKVGSYKSALEPFTRTDMSEADRQQNEGWLSVLWSLYTDRVTENRNIESNALAKYTNNIGEFLDAAHGNIGQLALNNGLVDHLFTRQEISTHLLSIVDSEMDKPSIISSSKYLELAELSFREQNQEDSIGIIIAEGTILPGKQPTGVIGGESLSQLIKIARKDNQIQGLVLRINSGGGSAFASEVIRQEILEFKKSGKSFVVSMGSVAASGGYWIAADADEIWAEASTITGSIGIFGAIPTFEKSLASLGVYSDGIGTTPLAAGLNISRPLSPALKSVIQQSVEYSYENFLQIVASGRNIKPRKVAELAQGRVYDGNTAKNLGLIDNIGHLEQAISAAAKHAGLTEYSASYITKPRSMKDQILTYLTEVQSAATRTPDSLLSKIKLSILTSLQPLLQLSDPQGIYAHCQLDPRL